MSTARERSLRVGVVGGGLIAQLVHLPLVQGARGLRVVAIAEPVEDVRLALARRFEISAEYADHRAMLAAGGLDAVIVCSPNETHAGVTVDALEAGCAVLVEKPLCLAPADGTAILEAARRSGCVAQVGYMKQFDPAVLRFMDSLPQSELLRVHSVTVDNAIGERFRPSGHTASATPSDARPYSLAFCGALIHDVNLVLNVLARLGLEASAIGASGASAGTSATCHCELSNGGAWTSSWRLAPDARRFRETLHFAFSDGLRSLSLPMPYAEVERAYMPQLGHFAARIRCGDASLASIEEGIRDVALLDDAYRRVGALTA